MALQERFVGKISFFKNRAIINHFLWFLKYKMIICVHWNQFVAGYPESAVQLLKKCGKILDPMLPNDAADLYMKAAETVLTEDRPKQAADFWLRIVKIQVDRQHYF